MTAQQGSSSNQYAISYSNLHLSQELYCCTSRANRAHHLQLFLYFSLSFSKYPILQYKMSRS